MSQNIENASRAETIAEGLRAVQTAIREASKEGQPPVLVAVSKTYPLTDIVHAYHLGQHVFGENKVQEILEKQEEARSLCPELEISWHLIGHLQRNKVRQIIGRVDLIHSVDSLRLIAEIGKRAAQASIIQPILLQINVSGEASKDGFAPSELEPALAACLAEPSLDLQGLMTMAPAAASEEEAEAIFSGLTALLPIVQEAYPQAATLSMGMSGDFIPALRAGSTMLRIGSLIFGPRVY